MATMPNAGPSAKPASTVGHPNFDASTGVSSTVAKVSAKPSAVWKVSRLPAWCGGEASATSAENCAESGTIDAPRSEQRER